METSLAEVLETIDRMSGADKQQILLHLMTQLYQDAEVQSTSDVSAEQRKVSAKEVLMSTQESWGSRTLDEIDAELDRQRQDDWSDKSVGRVSKVSSLPYREIITQETNDE